MSGSFQSSGVVGFSEYPPVVSCCCYSQDQVSIEWKLRLLILKLLLAALAASELGSAVLPSDVCGAPFFLDGGSNTWTFPEASYFLVFRHFSLFMHFFVCGFHFHIFMHMDVLTFLFHYFLLKKSIITCITVKE